MDQIRSIASLVVTIGAASGFIIGVFKGIYSIIATLKDMKEMMANQHQTNRVMFRGILAALRGLEKLGANGPVKEARKDMEEYLIKEAS